MHKKLTRIATGVALPALLMTAGVAEAQTRLTEGQSRTGQLTTDSQMLTENIHYLDSYTIQGQAGERIAISMQSDEFDTLLEIGRMVDGRFMELGRDDDGGGELNSRLVFTFPETGTYTVRARTFGAGVTGTYLIEANRLPPPPPPPPPTPMQWGQTVDGTLSVDSPSYEHNDYGGPARYYALYSLAGEAGQTATITLRSDDFDSYLEVGGQTPIGFAVQQSNDDGTTADGEEPLGLNSRLTVTFQDAGTIVIRATTLGGGATGSYSLTAE